MESRERPEQNQEAERTARANIALSPQKRAGGGGDPTSHPLSPPADSPFPAVDVTLEEYGPRRGRQGDDPIREGDNVR